MLIILISVSISLCYAQSQQSVYPTYKESDFPAKVLNYPNSLKEKWLATFHDKRKNRVFLYTIKTKQKKNCPVNSAIISIKIRNLGTRYNNDTMGFVENGKILFQTYLWEPNEPKNKSKLVTYNLAKLPKVGSILPTLNDGDFSLFIKDDTSVDFIHLNQTQSGKDCPPK